MKTQTVIRTALLVLALVNQILTAVGCNPLPFSQEQMYQGVTAAVTAAAALWAWWKNNSFTRSAQQADELLAQLREKTP